MYISIKNLDFQYTTKDPPVIKDFDYNIKKGQIIGVLGESGSGKSTLLRLIAGLETPQRGSMTIQDEIIFDEQHFLAPENRNIGMVFQDYALFPHMSVEKNIKYGLPKGIKKDKRVREVLALVNMEGYQRRYPHELSGGQQQRIALARALAPQPELLLLDEPFSSLDFDLQLKIRDELKEILKQAKMTTILVTHNRENCKAISDEIIELKNGEIVNNKFVVA